MIIIDAAAVKRTRAASSGDGHIATGAASRTFLRPGGHPGGASAT